MPRAIDILLVEDSIADIHLLKSVLSAEKLALRFFTVSSAHDAVAFLQQKGIYALMPTPDLVVLDWKLPTYEDGEQVLRAVHDDPQLKTLSVALVSGYVACDEKRRAKELGATCVVEKPLTLDKFISIVQQIPEMWLTIVRSPGGGLLS